MLSLPMQGHVRVLHSDDLNHVHVLVLCCSCSDDLTRDAGCHVAAEHVIRQVAGGRAGIEKVTVIDTSQDMLDRIKVGRREMRFPKNDL